MRRWIASGAAALLAACGGGGGTGSQASVAGTWVSASSMCTLAPPNLSVPDTLVLEQSGQTVSGVRSHCAVRNAVSGALSGTAFSLNVGSEIWFATYDGGTVLDIIGVNRFTRK